MTTVTTTIYGDGGWLPDEPGQNIVAVFEQDFDEDGNPVGEPRYTVGEPPA